MVLITHENDVAARANRIVRLRDGQMIDDRRTDKPHVPSTVPPRLRA